MYACVRIYIVYVEEEVHSQAGECQHTDRYSSERGQLSCFYKRKQPWKRQQKAEKPFVTYNRKHREPWMWKIEFCLWTRCETKRVYLVVYMSFYYLNGWLCSLFSGLRLVIRLNSCNSKRWICSFATQIDELCGCIAQLKWLHCKFSLEIHCSCLCALFRYSWCSFTSIF